MFLIEYRTGVFVNAENIEFLSIKHDKVTLVLSNNHTDILVVGKQFEGSFLNHLQMLNNGHSSVVNLEAAYHKAMSPG